jgi:hypothetical protein
MTKTLAHHFARLCGAFLLMTCAVAAGAAHAQLGHSLRDAILGRKGPDSRSHSLPVVGHFVSEDGESFVFDQTHPSALIRFDGDDETWVLTPTPGPKGDVIYKNDVGQPMLKVTRWGGMILFTDDRPMGDPASVNGKADPFTPAHMTPNALFQGLLRASRRVSLAVGRNFGFDAPDVTAGADYIYADAIQVTADALTHIASQPSGRKALDPVHGVQFVEGRPPSATLNNGVLVLKLDIDRGIWGGHVSSKRITNVVMASYGLADADR